MWNIAHFSTTITMLIEDFFFTSMSLISMQKRKVINNLKFYDHSLKSKKKKKKSKSANFWSGDEHCYYFFPFWS